MRGPPRLSDSAESGLTRDRRRQILTRGKAQNEEDGSLSVGLLGLGEVKGEEAYAREKSRPL
jgi:hypothetical protein